MRDAGLTSVRVAVGSEFSLDKHGIVRTVQLQQAETESLEIGPVTAKTVQLMNFDTAKLSMLGARVNKLRVGRDFGVTLAADPLDALAHGDLAVEGTVRAATVDAQTLQGVTTAAIDSLSADSVQASTVHAEHLITNKFTFQGPTAAIVETANLAPETTAFVLMRNRDNDSTNNTNNTDSANDAWRLAPTATNTHRRSQQLGFFSEHSPAVQVGPRNISVLGGGLSVTTTAPRHFFDTPVARTAGIKACTWPYTFEPEHDQPAIALFGARATGDAWAWEAEVAFQPSAQPANNPSPPTSSSFTDFELVLFVPGRDPTAALGNAGSPNTATGGLRAQLRRQDHDGSATLSLQWDNHDPASPAALPAGSIQPNTFYTLRLAYTNSNVTLAIVDSTAPRTPNNGLILSTSLASPLGSIQALDDSLYDMYNNYANMTGSERPWAAMRTGTTDTSSTPQRVVVRQAMLEANHNVVLTDVADRAGGWSVDMDPNTGDVGMGPWGGNSKELVFAREQHRPEQTQLHTSGKLDAEALRIAPRSRRVRLVDHDTTPSLVAGQAVVDSTKIALKDDTTVLFADAFPHKTLMTEFVLAFTVRGVPASGTTCVLTIAGQVPVDSELPGGGLSEALTLDGGFKVRCWLSANELSLAIHHAGRPETATSRTLIDALTGPIIDTESVLRLEVRLDLLGELSVAVSSVGTHGVEALGDIETPTTRVAAVPVPLGEGFGDGTALGMSLDAAGDTNVVVLLEHMSLEGTRAMVAPERAGTGWVVERTAPETVMMGMEYDLEQSPVLPAPQIVFHRGPDDESLPQDDDVAHVFTGTQFVTRKLRVWDGTTGFATVTCPEHKRMDVGEAILGNLGEPFLEGDAVTLGYFNTHNTGGGGGGGNHIALSEGLTTDTLYSDALVVRHAVDSTPTSVTINAIATAPTMLRASAPTNEHAASHGVYLGFDPDNDEAVLGTFRSNQTTKVLSMVEDGTSAPTRCEFHVDVNLGTKRLTANDLSLQTRTIVDPELHVYDSTATTMTAALHVRAQTNQASRLYLTENPSAYDGDVTALSGLYLEHDAGNAKCRVGAVTTASPGSVQTTTHTPVLEFDRAGAVPSLKVLAGELDMGGLGIVGLSTPETGAATDAANRAFVESHVTERIDGLDQFDTSTIVTSVIDTDTLLIKDHRETPADMVRVDVQQVTATKTSRLRIVEGLENSLRGLYVDHTDGTCTIGGVVDTSGEVMTPILEFAVDGAGGVTIPNTLLEVAAPSGTSGNTQLRVVPPPGDANGTSTVNIGDMFLKHSENGSSSQVGVVVDSTEHAVISYGADTDHAEYAVHLHAGILFSGGAHDIANAGTVNCENLVATANVTCDTLVATGAIDAGSVSCTAVQTTATTGLQVQRTSVGGAVQADARVLVTNADGNGPGLAVKADGSCVLGAMDAGTFYTVLRYDIEDGENVRFAKNVDFNSNRLVNVRTLRPPVTDNTAHLTVLGDDETTATDIITRFSTNGTGKTATLELIESTTSGMFVTYEGAANKCTMGAIAEEYTDSDGRKTILSYDRVNPSSVELFTALNLNDHELQNVHALHLDTSSTFSIRIGTTAPHASESGNVAVGASAMSSTTSAMFNVAVGINAARSLDTGDNNIAIGEDSLYKLTSGQSNVAIGSKALYEMTSATGNNVALGTFAFEESSSALECVGVGYSVGKNVPTVTRCVAIGGDAMQGPTSTAANIARDSVAVGHSALSAVQATSDRTVDGVDGYRADWNVAVGSQSLQAMTTGVGNVTVGGMAGYSVTTGTKNVAVGWKSLETLTTGHNNTVLGTSAGHSMTSGDSNVAVGWKSLEAATSADDNVAIGRLSLGLTTTGEQNVAVGAEALSSITTSSYNTAVGMYALRSNTSSSSGNVGVGRGAFQSTVTVERSVGMGYKAAGNLETATYCVALGYNAMLGANATSNTITRCVGVGYHALYSVSATSDRTIGTTTTYRADGNVAIGAEALYVLTTGVENVAVGDSAGKDLTTGYRNVIVGAGAGLPAAAAESDSCVIIGHNALSTVTATASKTGVVAIGAYAGAGRGLYNGSLYVGSGDTIENQLLFGNMHGENSSARYLAPAETGKIDLGYISTGGSEYRWQTIYGNTVDTIPRTHYYGDEVSSLFNNPATPHSLLEPYHYNLVLRGIDELTQTPEVDQYWGILADRPQWTATGTAESDLRGLVLGFCFNDKVTGETHLRVQVQKVGGLTTFNFTGQHRVVLEGHQFCKSLVGRAVVCTDSVFNLDGTETPAIDDTMPVVRLAAGRAQKSVFGVVSCAECNQRKQDIGGLTVYAPQGDNINRVLVNSVGEGAAWVCDANGPLENGDLCCTSRVASYFELQDDDLFHGYTALKVTQSVDFMPKMFVRRRVKLETVEVKQTRQATEMVADTGDQAANDSHQTAPVFNSETQRWEMPSPSAGDGEQHAPNLVAKPVFDLVDVWGKDADGNDVAVGTHKVPRMETITVTKQQPMKDEDGNYVWEDVTELAEDQTTLTPMCAETELRFLNVQGEAVPPMSFCAEFDRIQLDLAMEGESPAMAALRDRFVNVAVEPGATSEDVILSLFSKIPDDVLQDGRALLGGEDEGLSKARAKAAMLTEGRSVFRAAFVGCTYHCG